MLERLLELITRDNLVAVAELAQALDTSPEMVESMLDELERLGYLAAVPGCTTGACSGCSVQTGCRPVRLWTAGKRLQNKTQNNPNK